MKKLAQVLCRMNKAEKGFTLVELMVVVVIIGVLAAVVIPKFSGIIDNSKLKADVASGKTIKDAVDRWYVDKGTYPPVDGGALAAAQALVDDENQYLSETPKYAQLSGGVDSATFDKIFKISANGNVAVYKLNSDGTPGTNPEWTSGSN